MIKKILAYETSTNICSVAFQDENGNIFEKRIEGRGVHSDHVFLFTQELMKEHGFRIEDIDAVLTSNGPGSYTGLRIAASALKGLLFGKGVELFAVDTLASFAMNTNAEHGDTIHAVMDARRTHLYVQTFEFGDQLKSKTESKLMDISEFETEVHSGEHIIGTGINRLSEHIADMSTTYDEEAITAKSLIKLFKVQNFKDYCIKTELEALNPNYISSSQVNNTNS